MSEKERGDIMQALKELPESDKQFMLGYAAGRSASKPAEEGTAQQQVERKDG